MQQYSGFFLGSEIAQGSVDGSLFHVIPVPYEASVSYGGGTAAGPQAIIYASDQLETFDGLSEPCEEGIHTHAAVDCRGEPADVLERIRLATREVASRGQIPFVLGGEHTVSYGAVMGVVDACQGEKIGIVQFDAHADLRESYEGSIWSHASVMKRLVDEGLPLFQLGVRALSMEEKAVRDGLPAQIQYLDARLLCRDGLHHFSLPKNFPQKIYISVDIDGLDGALMPATGTPVPGGLAFWQLLDLFACALRGRELVGMDLVEFAPIKGFHVHDFTAADLAYKMMGMVARNRQDDKK